MDKEKNDKRKKPSTTPFTIFDATAIAMIMLIELVLMYFANLL
jgi:hypothetical protein